MLGQRLVECSGKQALEVGPGAAIPGLFDGLHPLGQELLGLDHYETVMVAGRYPLAILGDEQGRPGEASQCRRQLRVVGRGHQHRHRPAAERTWGDVPVGRAGDIGRASGSRSWDDLS